MGNGLKSLLPRQLKKDYEEKNTVDAGSYQRKEKKNQMKFFRKAIVIVTVLALVVALCGCAFGGSKKIGKKAALQAALEDAGLTRNEVTDVDVEYEKALSSAWYEVNFESGMAEYEYRIHAYTGEVLSSATD